MIKYIYLFRKGYDMNIYYCTFGCKVNQYETENIRQAMSGLGFSETDSPALADICVINTCTVTSSADKKLRQTVHSIKKSNPNAVIALMGCFPQAFRDAAFSLSEADIIIGASNKTKMPQYIQSYLSNRQKIRDIEPHTANEQFENMRNFISEGRTRANVKIEDGCDCYCTYCIIPYARGHVRSKPLSEIKQEIEQLARNGYKEIVLVGINLLCYGKDLNGVRLIDAIETACSVEGISRVRLSSLEPELISDDDIARMAALPKLCPQFHLSLQSGCDKTLKAMNRKYLTSEYELLVRKLRSAFPNCAVTTDIMVGFAGETEEDFLRSVEFAKRIGFAKVHIFPYSVRQGTVAAKMPNQVTKSEKIRRAKILEEAVRADRQAFLQSQTGLTEEVLFEKDDNCDFHHGYTKNYTPVRIPKKSTDASLRWQELSVRITGAEDDFCTGELV